MPTTNRTVALTTAALSAAALLAPATASGAGEDLLSRVPLHVSADCAVPMAATLPAAPANAPSCAGSMTAVAGDGAPAESVPCVAVVPLVDDRCEAWTARFDGAAGGADYPTGDLGGSRLLAVSPDSATVFAAGTSDGDPSTASGWAGRDMDVVVLGFDAATGESRWTLRRPESDQSFAHHIVADPDGDLVYATSHDYAEVGECQRQATTVAVEQTTGAQVWTARESAPSSGCFSAYTTTLDPAGERLFTVASAEGPNGNLEQTLIARDADTGQHLWTASAGGLSALGETGTTVAVSPDGRRVYAGGSVLADGGSFPKHVAWSVRGYDTATGERVFETSWNTPLPDSPTPANTPAAMTVSPDGESVYVAGGVTHIHTRFFDITAVAFDTGSGQQRWMYRYDGPRDKSSFDSVWYNGALALSGDGTRIAIAGYSTHFLIGVNLQLDLATVFLDAADGRAVWETRYTAENETNWIPSVAMSPDATKVYVAAPSRYAVMWQAPARYTTLAYEAADGTVAWTARHSDGHSFAQGSALTPDGKRFIVTGMTADAGPQTASDVDWGIGLAAYPTD